LNTVLKILILAPQPFYQERGTPIAVKLLAETLAEQGNNVHLLVFAEGETPNLPGVTIHRHVALPGLSDVKPGFSVKKLLCDFLLFIKAIRLVYGGGFQLIHAVEEAVFMAGCIKILFKIPYVYDMDSSMSVQLVDKFPFLRSVRTLMERLEGWAILGASGVLPVCRALEDIVRRRAPDILVVRLEDVSLLGEGENGAEDLRKELEIDGIMLMYVGNLEYYQGIDLLLESFQYALTADNDLNLVLIGGSERDIRGYREKSRKLGISNRVFFCGGRPVGQLGFYLSQADILVSPRVKGENTPMKIYSYLDSGKAVLATKLPTHTQVMDGEISCLVVAEQVAFAGAMVRLAKDGKLRKTLGEKARQRVREEYSPFAFKRKLKLFYDTLQQDLDGRL